jgi:hypothetical protein
MDKVRYDDAGELTLVNLSLTGFRMFHGSQELRNNSRLSGAECRMLYRFL